MKLVHWYDLTPSELFLQHDIVADEPHATLHLERFAFPQPIMHKLNLNGHSFMYQLGLSAIAVNDEVRALREAHPEIPATCDSRSGIIVLRGLQVVGNFILTGQSPSVPYMRLVVHPEFRRLGMARTMLVMWGTFCKRQHDAERIAPIVVTATTARVMLEAHAELVAMHADRASPTAVQAVANGAQRAEILRRIAKVRT